MDRYFIKTSYKTNEFNITNDKVSNEIYWSKKRILSSKVYQFPVYKYLSNYIKKFNVNKVIDIGCGVAKKLEYVNKQNHGLKIIGIDQEDPIAYCKKTYNFGEWYIDDFENTQLNKEITSNLIVCSDVIEHLINPDLLINYIKTKIEKEGVLILSTPERDIFRGSNCNYSPNKHHIREWNYNELEQYLESRGFEIIEHFLQYPVKMAFNKIFFSEIIMRALKMKPLKYNQIVIAKIK